MNADVFSYGKFLLWNDKAITIENNTVFWRDWFKREILVLHDVLNADGNFLGGRDRGRETGRKGGGRCTGGGRRGGERRDSKGGGKWEKREKKYATLRNISQSKKCKGAGVKKYRAGTGIKGYGKREVQTPLFPPPPTSQRLKNFKTSLR